MISGLFNSLFDKISYGVSNASLAQCSLALVVGGVAIGVFKYYFGSADNSPKPLSDSGSKKQSTKSKAAKKASVEPSSAPSQPSKASHTLDTRSKRINHTTLQTRRAEFDKEMRDAERLIKIKGKCDILYHKAESLQEYAECLKDNSEKTQLIEAMKKAKEMVQRSRGCNKIEDFLPIFGVATIDELEKSIDTLLKELEALNAQFSQAVIGISAAVLTALLFS